MKYPTTRFVFDRKKTATKKQDALIQVEVLFERKRKYIGTGVKVFKDQWNGQVCKREDMDALNARIDAVKSQVDNYITQLMKSGSAWDWDAFGRYLSDGGAKTLTFVQYIDRRITERTDITDSTKRSHRKIIATLEEYGRMIGFEQLTKPNIIGYYEWLTGRDIVKIAKDGLEYKTKMATQTVWSYMKILRTYIHDAMVHDRMDRDPSLGLKIRRGDTVQARWLTEQEVAKLEKAKLSKGSLSRVRDLFIFSCYSGLAFSDLMDFNTEKLENDGKNTFLIGHRVKTGEEYVVLVLPKAKAILEKYNYKLPRYSNQQFNHRLKMVATEAGIDKPISSHWARHTAAMLFINKGIRLETVAKILGHSSVKTTEQVYASILKKTVVEEMSKLK